MHAFSFACLCITLVCIFFTFMSRDDPVDSYSQNNGIKCKRTDILREEKATSLRVRRPECEFWFQLSEFPGGDGGGLVKEQ